MGLNPTWAKEELDDKEPLSSLAKVIARLSAIVNQKIKDPDRESICRQCSTITQSRHLKRPENVVVP